MDIAGTLSKWWNHRVSQGVMLLAGAILLFSFLLRVPSADQAVLGVLERLSFDLQMKFLRTVYPRPAIVEPVLIGIDESAEDTRCRSTRSRRKPSLGPPAARASSVGRHGRAWDSCAGEAEPGSFPFAADLSAPSSEEGTFLHRQTSQPWVTCWTTHSRGDALVLTRTARVRLPPMINIRENRSS